MIKTIIFDMDGTLYSSVQIKDRFAEAAYHTLAKVKNINVEKARIQIQKKREELKRDLGDSAPYTLTLQSLGVPINTWHTENIEFFDPGDYLRKDERLITALRKLKNHYCLAVLTNNNSIQTDRTLCALGLNAIFDRVFTYNSYGLLKPDPEFLRRAIQDLGLLPEECLIVGDRYNVDLSPAKDLGMHIHEVHGPEDICTMTESMIVSKEHRE